MIFAAGMGTRLHPVTKEIPKALVKINGITLLEIVVRRLIRFGFDEIIINIHHFSDKVIEFVHSKNNFDINIQFSDESEELLDTGGGLKKAAWFFDDNKPFLVHNVDVLSDVDLNGYMDYHKRLGALATLAVRNRTTSRYLLFDENDTLCGWQNIKTGEQIFTKRTENKKSEYFPFAFSGIHIINPEIFKYINKTGSFSIIDVYLQLANEHKIICYNHNESLWIDVGKIDSLNEAENLFNSLMWP